MQDWQALILGVVEGLTEYLPVSSTGHLLLAQRLMGMPENAAANAYAVSIQAGAIVAILGMYFPRVRSVWNGLLGRDAEGRRLGVALLAGFLPAAVIGFTCHDWVERHLFGLTPIAWAWGVGGVGILLVERVRRGRGQSGKTLAALTAKGALLIGIAQCVALWPGTSRSLATILGGLLIGLRLSAAVEFSFLLGVITLLAATGYSALSDGRVMLDSYSVPSMLVGFLSAWVAAVVSVKWMVAYLNRHGLNLFGWYRIALAIGVAVWLSYDVL